MLPLLMYVVIMILSRQLRFIQPMKPCFCLDLLMGRFVCGMCLRPELSAGKTFMIWLQQLHFLKMEIGPLLDQ